MDRLIWQSATARERAVRQGSDALDGFAFPSSTPVKRQSKADMRKEIAAAAHKITRVIDCGCGRRGSIVMLTSRCHKKLRCSRCGAVQ
ncbi:hypothetical protein FHW00_001786 [Ochrobactrum sp. P6BSIII]|nr:hypothetical protein [Ochrobactrum sp. P6BSIII]